MVWMSTHGAAGHCTMVLFTRRAFVFLCFHPDGWHHTVGQSEVPALITSLCISTFLSFGSYDISDGKAYSLYLDPVKQKL